MRIENCSLIHVCFLLFHFSPMLAANSLLRSSLRFFLTILNKHVFEETIKCFYPRSIRVLVFVITCIKEKLKCGARQKNSKLYKL